MNAPVKVTHTPGPWVIAPRTEEWMSRLSVIGPRGDNGPVYVCEVEDAKAPSRHRCTAPKESAEANARLIAAAPDLLAACKALVALESVHMEIHTTDRCEICEARAAIAKAEGGDA